MIISLVFTMFITKSYLFRAHIAVVVILYIISCYSIIFEAAVDIHYEPDNQCQLECLKSSDEVAQLVGWFSCVWCV